jgi:2-polyprenyl-3-methyl-5-hydroxy-6-metoxy-1,4-benzoquinol methylase
MSIKSQLSGFLRKTNLLSFAERMRFYWQKRKYKKDNDQFKKDHPDFALPPEFFIYETYRLNYKWYYDDGKNTAKEIIELLSRQLDISQPGIRILDWGCGPGRIIRHFPISLPNAEISGTDYNGEYIKWCSKNLNKIDFSVNKIDPPTNYDDSFFDVVIGLSIFTHLSERSHNDWIAELYRIVKPGGFIFITTHGKAYYSKLTSAEKKQFDSNDLVIREYSNEGNRLYSSFQPTEFIKKLILGKFVIAENIEGEINNNEPSQDIWLLKKF